jgi:hypothetical protein
MRYFHDMEWFGLTNPTNLGFCVKTLSRSEYILLDGT